MTLSPALQCDVSNEPYRTFRQLTAVSIHMASNRSLLLSATGVITASGNGKHSLCHHDSVTTTCQLNLDGIEILYTEAC